MKEQMPGFKTAPTVEDKRELLDAVLGGELRDTMAALRRWGKQLVDERFFVWKHMIPDDDSAHSWSSPAPMLYTHRMEAMESNAKAGRPGAVAGLPKGIDGGLKRALRFSALDVALSRGDYEMAKVRSIIDELASACAGFAAILLSLGTVHRHDTHAVAAAPLCPVPRHTYRHRRPSSSSSPIRTVRTSPARRR